LRHTRGPAWRHWPSHRRAAHAGTRRVGVISCYPEDKEQAQPTNSRSRKIEVRRRPFPQTQ
jgi:hypothetical protein